MKHTAILSPRAAALERIKALVLDTFHPLKVNEHTGNGSMISSAGLRPKS